MLERHAGGTVQQGGRGGRIHRAGAQPGGQSRGGRGGPAGGRLRQDQGGGSADRAGRQGGEGAMVEREQGEKKK